MNTHGPFSDDELVTAFREQPTASRTSSQVEDAAQRFVRATQERIAVRHRRRTFFARYGIVLAIAGALALFVLGRASALLFIGPRSPMQAEAPAVSIEAAPGAVFERIERGPIRAARLHEGSVVVSIDPSPPASSADAARASFVVVTGDAEVRAASGLFEVVARADRLVRVRAIDTEVTLRGLAGDARIVARGETFDPPPPSVDPTGRTEAREHMNQALELLAGGSLDAAAARFRSEAESPGSPFVEDAAFWEAIAIARGRTRAAARPKLESFLARFPSSAHKLEALSVLGWILLENGDTDGARGAFEDSRESDDARVRASAMDGLKRMAPARRLK